MVHKIQLTSMKVRQWSFTSPLFRIGKLKEFFTIIEFGWAVG